MSLVVGDGSKYRLGLLSAGSEDELARGLAKLQDDLAGGTAARSARGEEQEPYVHVYEVASGPTRHRGAVLSVPNGADRRVECSSGLAADASRPAVMMFPGLGEHYVDMGGELFRTHLGFRAEVARCAELLLPEIGVDIREIVFPEPAPTEAAAPPAKLDLRRMLGRAPSVETPAERRLGETRLVQPALFVVEYALARVWNAWGLTPEAMIGYSLGEYVAACLSGVLSLEDSLMLVARRAELIESLPRGGMLAVGLSEQAVSEMLGEHLAVSAVNAPELCVIAGPLDEIEAFERRLEGRDVAARRVASSHAFHTRMMDPIAERLTRLAETCTLRAPRIPYVSNVTGKLILPEQAVDPSYWATHLRSPVRFADGVRSLSAAPARVLLESGPGQTLSSMALANGAQDIVASMRHRFDPQPDTAVLLRALLRLWLAGAALDWSCFGRSKIALDAPSAPPNAPRVAALDTELDATERELAAIWTKLLGKSDLTRQADFFEIGGNSLIATRLVHRISRTFGVKLSHRRLYEAPTLSTMAEAIRAEQRGAAASDEPPAPRGISRYELPNSMVIWHQNEGETKHFYEDIFAHRSYLRHGLRITDGACVFDVGGNIGLFTLFANREARNVRVFTFEPAPPLFEILRRNVSEQKVDAVLFNCGLSNREREASFTYYPRSSGMSSFHADEAEERHNLKTIIDNQERGVSVAGDSPLDPVSSELLDYRFEAHAFPAKLRRLSEVLREQAVDRVDLLKVDVQRCELEVIEGIDDGDWPKIRQIALEVHDIDGRLATLTSLLEHRGFSVRSLQDRLYIGTNISNVYATRVAG